jgi:hypothetical protein
MPSPEEGSTRPLTAQTIPTFLPISLITVSSLPLSTCLAKLRVNPLTVWKGEWDGMASANGSTTASTTTGPSLYARASALWCPDDRERHGFLNRPALTCCHPMTSEGFCSCREMR